MINTKNKIIIGIIIVAVIIVIVIIASLNFQKKPIKYGKLSEDCINILNGIKNTNPAELGSLYDEIVLYNLDPHLVFTACDYGPEEVTRACIERETIHGEKLTCMKSLLNGSKISKEELMKIDKFE